MQAQLVDADISAMKGRRSFLKRGASAIGLAWMGYEGIERIGSGAHRTPGDSGLVLRGQVPEQLDNFSRIAQYGQRQGSMIRCTLCPHECVLAEGDRGFCRARGVRQGQLRTLAYGNLCAIAVDPIEKKPLYHFLPQSEILSVAMGGCNLRCPNCQNWQISQSFPEQVTMHGMQPQQLVDMAVAGRYPSIAFTYTEPMVTFEYVRDTSKLARDRGVKTVLVTAGYVQREPLLELAKYVDAMQLDVKSFDDASYASVVRGRLHPVLRTIEVMRHAGVWVELSYLMVTGLTDDVDQVRRLSRWMVRQVGKDVPLHLLRFHPAHRLTHLIPTPIPKLGDAAEAAKREGLAYVYLGNVPGLSAGRTVCPNDGQVLVERQGYHVLANRLRDGACPRCGERIAGVYAA